MQIDWDQLKKEYITREKYRPILQGGSEHCDRCGARMEGERCNLRCPKCGLVRTCDE